MKSLCVIPARMGSSRFSGKPLEPLLGLPLVLHVYERCRLATTISKVVIATCDAEIEAACQAYGAEVVMTRDDHPGAVDRAAEAADLTGTALSGNDLVLMVQGDEALVAPDMIDPVVETFAESRPPVVNLASPIFDDAEHSDPNVVKVVKALDGSALFFSRAPIPSSVRMTYTERLQQTGVIGFARDFLATFLKLERTPLELSEGIDMLRAIEHGYQVLVVPAPRSTIGVDTPSDLKNAEAILAEDPLTKYYLKATI